MNQRTTTKLDEILINIDKQDELNNYLNKDNVLSEYDYFIDYFLSLEKINSMNKADLIRLSGIERTYGYQILNKTKDRPSKDKIIRLALAGKLTLNETIKALEAGKENVLYSRNKRDAIIIFALNNNLSVNETNDLLDNYGEEILN